VLTRFPAEELLVAGKVYVRGADLLDRPVVAAQHPGSGDVAAPAPDGGSVAAPAWR
jgi:hypothetical protein